MRKRRRWTPQKLMLRRRKTEDGHPVFTQPARLVWCTAGLTLKTSEPRQDSHMKAHSVHMASAPCLVHCLIQQVTHSRIKDTQPACLVGAPPCSVFVSFSRLTLNCKLFSHSCRIIFSAFVLLSCYTRNVAAYHWHPSSCPIGRILNAPLGAL